MTFSGCDTSPTVDCCSFSKKLICRTLSPGKLGRVADTDFFFLFFFLLTRRELGERGDKILRWRHSNCTHYDACRRETAGVFRETFSRKIERPFDAPKHRTDWTSLESKRTPRDFPRPLFLYPVPSAAARAAPNGVKERASFCLVFRSLNTMSSHIKAGPPLDLSFWSFLTFLHHGIEEVERHLL